MDLSTALVDLQAILKKTPSLQALCLKATPENMAFRVNRTDSPSVESVSIVQYVIARLPPLTTTLHIQCNVPTVAGLPEMFNNSLHIAKAIWSRRCGGIPYLSSYIVREKAVSVHGTKHLIMQTRGLKDSEMQYFFGLHDSSQGSAALASPDVLSMILPHSVTTDFSANLNRFGNWITPALTGLQLLCSSDNDKDELYQNTTHLDFVVSEHNVGRFNRLESLTIPLQLLVRNDWMSKIKYPGPNHSEELRIEPALKSACQRLFEPGWMRCLFPCLRKLYIQESSVYLAIWNRKCKTAPIWPVARINYSKSSIEATLTLHNVMLAKVLQAIHLVWEKGISVSGSGSTQLASAEGQDSLSRETWFTEFNFSSEAKRMMRDLDRQTLYSLLESVPHHDGWRVCMHTHQQNQQNKQGRQAAQVASALDIDSRLAAHRVLHNDLDSD